LFRVDLKGSAAKRGEREARKEWGARGVAVEGEGELIVSKDIAR